MGALHRFVPWLAVVLALASGCNTRRCVHVAQAIRAGDDAAAITALGNGRVPSCRLGPEGYTLLHEAAVAGRTAVITELLARGAPLEAPSRMGRTPFYEACKQGQLAAAEQLLAQGARLDEPQGPARVRPLYAAAQEKQGPLVAMLLAHGAEVDARSGADQTALHHVAHFTWQGDDSIARLLVAHGAAWEVHDNQGWTPLAIAAAECNTPFAAYAIAQGANIDARTDDGETPLGLSRTHHCTGVEQALVAAHAHTATDL